MSKKTIRFNSGKVDFNEDTNKCIPLPHKGIISIKPSAEDEGFFDFTWTPKNSGSGNVEKDELLIIPGDVTFKRIASCKTGRVFSLTFLSSGAKHLYWLQDVGDDEELNKWTEKDESLLKDIEELLAAPLEDDDDTHTDETKPASVKEETNDHDADRRSQPAAVAQQPQQLPSMMMPITSVADFLDTSMIERHLDTLSPQQISQLYAGLLPESSSDSVTKQDVLDIVRSGFFQQASSSMSESLNNGAGALMAQMLEYPYRGEGVENFIKGIRESSKKDKQSEDDTNSN